MSNIEENRPALESQLTRRRVLIGLAATGGVVVAGDGIIWLATSSKLAPHLTPTPTPLPPIGTLLFTYDGPSEPIIAVAWSPDGKRIASAYDWNGTVQVWDAVDGNHVFTYNGHSGSVSAVAWSPDGKRIASTDDKTMQVWVAS